MGGQLNRTNTAALTTHQPPDAGTMRTIIATVLAVITAAALISYTKPQPIQPAHESQHASEQTPVKQADVATAVAAKTQQVEPVAPAPKPTPPPEPPKPAPWAVSASPHARTSVADINTALAHLQTKGLTKEGASYLVGNFIAESYLIPCGQYGDGGQAHGLAQWHPGRRGDMPCGLIAQLDWALDIEMARDSAAGHYGCLCEAVKTADIALIQQRIKQWERYGVEAGRYVYGAQIYAQL